MSTAILGVVMQKLRRDQSLSLRARIRKGVKYVWGLAASRYYLRQVSRVGHHVRTIGKPRIENLGRLEIGSGVLLTSTNVPVELGTGPDGVLRIGDGARVNYGTSMFAQKAVSIGHRVRIGPHVMIVDTDFHDPYLRSKRPDGIPVVLEDDVWVGAKASILKGVRVGRGAIIGVGSVVTKSVEPFAVVAGVPARPVGALDPARFQTEDTV